MSDTKFIITTETNPEDENYQITIFIPVGPCSFFRATHFPESKDPNGEVVPEVLIIENPLLTTTAVSVPLKHMKRVKQNKMEEFFQLEQVEKVYQPMYTRLNNKEEIQSIIETMKQNKFN